MKSHFVTLFCSLVWCFSQAEERSFLEPRGHLILDSHRLEDAVEVPHILESNTHDAIPEQDYDSERNTAYYNFIKNDQDDDEPKFERKIHIFSRPQEALRMKDAQYKPLRDFFLRQLESKDLKVSEEHYDIEKEMNSDRNEDSNSDKFFTKLVKDSITAWPIHMSPEQKTSLLGKSIWKKKSYVSEHHFGVDQNKTDEKISNDTETSALVNASTENPDMITDLIYNADVLLNVTKVTEDVKIVNTSKVKNMEEDFHVNKTDVETKETDSKLSTSKTSFPFSKSTIYESTFSDIDADIKDEKETLSESSDNFEMPSSPLEKEPIHLGNEPLHQSFLYKSLDFRPVKFFPSPERDFIVPNVEVIKENQHKKEKPQVSFRMPIKESASPDLFPSSVFEDEIKIPFFYIDS